MNRTASALCMVLSGAAVMALAACEEEFPPQPQPPPPTAQTSPATQPPATQATQPTGSMPQGGGSALGSAKRSAHNLSDQVDQQQRDLLREMGEDPPPPPSDDE